MAATTVDRSQTGNVLLVCAVAWAVPGAAHLWLRRRTKGLVFLTVLPLMFAVGIALKGRLFPFGLDDPLGTLAFLAELGVGVPYFVAWALGYGAGQVTAITFEYANTFLIAAGLLNSLVVLDARDIALGRKTRGAVETPR